MGDLGTYVEFPEMEADCDWWRIDIIHIEFLRADS